jgi:hypothetical protein
MALKLPQILVFEKLGNSGFRTKLKKTEWEHRLQSELKHRYKQKRKITEFTYLFS